MFLHSAVRFVGVLLGFATVASEATIVALHSFAVADGQSPQGTLLMVGATLYGETSAGGANSAGTVFSMSSDGSTFTVQHAFSKSADGGLPQGNGGLIDQGGTLYGVATYGGPFGGGTIFDMGAAGGFAPIHGFNSTTTTVGFYPYGSLVSTSTNLYGMTSSGGANSSGVIYQSLLNGANYTKLYDLPTSALPNGGLTLSGTLLYGMTASDGSGSGTVFSFDPTAKTYTVLHAFAGGAADGANPFGNVTVVSGKIYGMTNAGGTKGNGVVFSMNADGSGYSVLHNFAGGASDGSQPAGSLVYAGGKLFGMTLAGGSAADGAIFSIGLNGSGFSLVDSFTSSTGITPYGDLIFDGNYTLYGMTSAGGANGLGTVFSDMALPEPSPALFLFLTTAILGLPVRVRRGRRQS